MGTDYQITGTRDNHAFVFAEFLDTLTAAKGGARRIVERGETHTAVVSLRSIDGNGAETRVFMGAMVRGAKGVRWIRAQG